MNVMSLLAPLEYEQFSREYWGKKPFYSGIVHELPNDLPNWETIKKYLKDPNFYKKACVLLRSNSFEVDEQQPKSLGDVEAGVKRGLTCQIRLLQRVLPQNSLVVQLGRAFEQFILQPLDSITFFYSLPDSQPTAIHKDLGEIFSIQLAGKKRWKIAPEKCITAQMSFTEEEFTQYQSYELEAGNLIYSPSYLPHQVKCVESASSSIAFVFRNIQMGNILEYLKETNNELKEWLIKPLPIMGVPLVLATAQEEITKFKSILINAINQLNAGSTQKELASALSVSIQEQK
jgi:ribosomal protein L16 Arg81 hydroxylase